MSNIINIRSDTVTHPTDEMRKAMFEAEVGDDVSEADPTVNKLQKLASEITGMEASLFVPSGTMGNLVALMCHCPAGKEVFLEADSHIVLNEVGGVARVAGLMPNVLKGKRFGIIDPDDLRAAIRPYNIHRPTPGLICIENTHNVCGGTVQPIEYLKEYRKISDEFDLKFHMDGARVFNAATALGIDVKEIVKYTDSVTFCLSKGLSAPVGSMLCGKKEFIKDAIRIRKMLGGGMRQAGILAAAGIISLNQMTDRLDIDHRIAKILADGLSTIKGITIDLEAVQTNMVYLDLADEIINAECFSKEMEEKHGILCDVKGSNLIRLVVHRQISEDNAKHIIDSARSVMTR